MPSLKEVRSRIASVNSTQQITKAMKMVSAAKLRRAQDNIMRMRPYASKLGEMVSTVTEAAQEESQSPFKQLRPVNKVMLVVITSDRGLCGAFNSNVIKAAIARLNTTYAAQLREGNVEILSIGKKGGEGMARRGFKVNNAYEDLFGRLTFVNVKSAAEFIMQGFKDDRYDVVEIVYNEFKNVATQIVKTEQLLPLKPKSDTPKRALDIKTNYIFEPSEGEILDLLIPKTIKVQLYRAVLESNAAEYGARMTAMDKATENAQELLKDLKLVYNRTRQAAITKEILEIVGGAEALAN